MTYTQRHMHKNFLKYSAECSYKLPFVRKQTYKLQMILFKVSLESTKSLLNDGAKF